ncbi:hypothetical protein [Lysobacter sp. 22409]|uniref:hypothetical protein n=1 Tax=Lysobacter sp. 22409 TaxID=3453917 RepID=UPI003F834439
MLRRIAAAAEAKAIDFDSVEAKLISGGRSTHLQVEQPQGGLDVADLVLDVQEEITYQLNNVSNIVQTFVDPRLRHVSERFAKG